MTCLSQSRESRAISDLRFVYDGWNLIGTLNSQLSTLDPFVLSTLNLQLSTPFQPSTHFVSYDGNGNVTTLVNAADGSESARYEYGPFGEVIRATGPMAKINPFRFSTKFQDDETDLVMYSHRPYSPYLGQWLCKDPLAELGFDNLRHGKAPPSAAGEPNRYLFVRNNPVNICDPLGLDIWVIRDASGVIRHLWALGDNADGSFWSTDFMPKAPSLIGRLNCGGIINFTPKNLILDPENLSPDYVIERHTVVSQTATDAARDYAKQRSEQADQPRYDACGNNCIDWANGIANFAIGRQIRENLDKIKNEKR